MDNTYSIQDETLTAIGDAIRKKTNTTELLTPIEMAEVIDTIPDPVVIEPIVLTGDCSNACSGQLSSAYINLFGDTITTNNITKSDDMFASNKALTKIPFDINFSSSAAASMDSMFQNCSNLEEIKDIVGAKIGASGYLFQSCNRLRYLPNFINCSAGASSSSKISTFQNCFSLREVPAYILQLLIEQASIGYYYSFYYTTFAYCSTLNKVIDMPISISNYTSNAFPNHLTQCFMLSRYTFETNEDGTPKTAQWRSQTLDFSSCCGYTNGSTNNVLSYNSGITADKEVKDDATYQALKNDPDYFTHKMDYSHYNRTSAVETINSLPDCSATGTNTIKFKGAAGSKTDGGAINTMTEEEIAVATAKGWTVSFS